MRNVRNVHDAHQAQPVAGAQAAPPSPARDLDADVLIAGVDAPVTRKLIDSATAIFDFLWDAGMRWSYIESHLPALKNTRFVGNPGNTGYGIRIAQRLGADITGYTPQGHPHCVEVAPGKAQLWPRYEFLAEAGAILVNGEGQRFCNEPVKGCDGDRQPIPRLYDAGGTIGGYTNEAGYRSGWHLTNAFVFGRVAGRNITAETPWA